MSGNYLLDEFTEKNYAVDSEFCQNEGWIDEIALDSEEISSPDAFDSNVANIDEKAASTLKTVLSEEGLGLMGAAASVIKDFMKDRHRRRW